MRFQQQENSQGGSSPSGPDESLITQEMLVELIRLRDLQRRLNELREQILRLVDAGAEVEAGEYYLEVNTAEQKRLTAASLKKLLGADEINRLKRLVTPTVIRTILVERWP